MKQKKEKCIIYLIWKNFPLHLDWFASGNEKEEEEVEVEKQERDFREGKGPDFAVAVKTA